jgi:gluconolactonase
MQVERVVSGLKFAEGPAWSREGFLVFSDIPAEFIYRMQIGEDGKIRRSVWREQSGGANGNAFDAQGRLYTCEAHARRVTRTTRKDQIETLAESWQGKRLNSPNDIVVRHDGHVYFTDPAFGIDNDKRELDFYGIFHISPKGELALVAKWQTRPNGVALSPDGKTLYVDDSDTHSVHAFELERSGAASNDRVLISNIDGVPDGMRTDEKGNLYVAANGIQIYTAAGKPLQPLMVSERPSNLAFGDADFQSLYITARDSVFRVRMNVKGSVQY